MFDKYKGFLPIIVMACIAVASYYVFTYVGNSMTVIVSLVFAALVPAYSFRAGAGGRRQ